MKKSMLAGLLRSSFNPKESLDMESSFFILGHPSNRKRHVSYSV